MVTIGIDLGGTNIAAGIVDENCSIIARDSVPTGLGRPFDDIIRDMGGLVNRLLEQNHVALADVRWIGVGAPGVVDNETGTITDNSNFHWENYPIRQQLQRYIDRPVFLGNDANVAAWAEYVGGCGKGTKNFLLMTLGTGVGGGIVLGGKLFTGSHNTAAEVGHMIFRAGGVKCGCGNHGCIESYCSATALIRRAKEALEGGTDSVLCKAEPLNAKAVCDAAAAGDKLACRVFDEYVTDLAQVVASMVNMLDPDVIALGGGVAGAGEFLLAPVRERFPQYVTFFPAVHTEVMAASLGNEAGILGAAMLGEA